MEIYALSPKEIEKECEQKNVQKHKIIHYLA
jgi:hypothetical protein